MATAKQRRKAEPAALMSALTTEHVVLQSALSATISEGGSRASTYLYALSGALVALGFCIETTAFLPLAATVLPAVFLLGVFTVFRLVDIAIENIQAQIHIARIRAHYRSLGDDAAELFAPEHGRWPEGEEPSLRIGPFIGIMTTAATMVACVNAFVAGAGATLLAHRAGGLDLGTSVAVGAVAALALVGGFHAYQSFRIYEIEGWREIRRAAGRGPGSA